MSVSLLSQACPTFSLKWNKNSSKLKRTNCIKIARKFDKLISKEWPTIDSLCWFYLHCIYLSKVMNCWLLQISPNCVQYMIFILAYILRCLVNNSWKQEWRSSEWRRRKKSDKPEKEYNNIHNIQFF